MTVTALTSNQPRVISQVPVPPESQLVVQAATEQAEIATTQAGIATEQAEIATTQAGIATTKANEASESSASIRIDSATYAEIPSLTNPCFVFVDADETNDNEPTVYFFNGDSLQWLPSVGV